MVEAAAERLCAMFRSVKPHPIDVECGIRTAGRVSPRRILTPEGGTVPTNVGYAGSQPSIIRRVLELLPNVEGAIFIDIGCGKGRACVVASEYPFAAIIGKEIGVALAAVARQNARRVAGRFPERTRIQIELGDALGQPLPGAGPCVVFLYNPFGEALTRTLIGRIEAAVATNRKVFVICYNPVYFALFDSSPILQRYYAERLEFTAAEAGCAEFDNSFDSVVVWQGRAGPSFPPLPGAARDVHVTVPNLAASVRNWA